MATYNSINESSSPFTVSSGNLTVTSGNVVITAGSCTIGATSADANAKDLDFIKSRSGAVITTGDVLGVITFQGYDSTQYLTSSKITSTSSGTIAANRVASDLKFYTHPDSTSASTLQLTIGPTGATTFAGNDVVTFTGFSATSPSVSHPAIVLSTGNFQMPTSTYTSGYVAGSNFICNGVMTWGSYYTVIGCPGSDNFYCGPNAGRVDRRNDGYALRNTAIGAYAGNGNTQNSNTNQDNVCVGAYAGNNVAGDSSQNVFIGNYAGYSVNANYHNQNTCVGYYAGKLLTGSNNTFIGHNAAQAVVGTGSYGYNIVIGSEAGSAYNSSTVHDNIIIGGPGVAGETNKIRIGAQGTGNAQQNACFIAGIYNTNVGATAGVVLADSNGQLGGIAGTSSQVLIGGTSPSWGQVPLGSAVSGVLAPSNGGILPITEITGSPQAIAINNAYIASTAALLTFTLPAAATLGSRFQIIGKGAGFWQITQGAGQTVHSGGSSSTTGAGGTTTSSQQWASALFVCTTANTDWVIVESVGTITLA
jgi:hypothetical protein